jgi:L-aspartate oxidase
MPRYHASAELAPRDVVTRAIMNEIKDSGFPHVWLDATHLGGAFLNERFPSIAQACARFGIDIASQWIPVHPSAHYHCGGVRSDARGASTLPGLWTAGEVGCTGLHGANRLASNSILEGLVMGIRAGDDAAAAGGRPGRIRFTEAKGEVAPDGLDVPDLVRSLRSLMWRLVGIERHAADLAMARRSLAFWMKHQARGEVRSRDGWELQNLLLVSSIIATAAEMRTASVGTHTRTDSHGAIDVIHHAFVKNSAS